jgi:hypothetical protein
MVIQAMSCIYRLGRLGKWSRMPYHLPRGSEFEVMCGQLVHGSGLLRWGVEWSMGGVGNISLHPFGLLFLKHIFFIFACILVCSLSI